MSAIDTSFELPVDPNEGYGDPFPLGDEVSSGQMRQVPISLEQPPRQPESHSTPLMQQPQLGPRPGRVTGK